MEVQMLHPDKLKPYDKNPRTHSEHQIHTIAKSIKEFGFVNPILVDEHRGIIAGHGRLAAARSLGLTEVPVLKVTHLTPDQIRAYVIADNKIAMNAGWDVALLTEELKYLEAAEFSLDIVGFNEAEFASLTGAHIKDPLAEWKGMPDYEQEHESYRAIYVHFRNQNDVEEFLNLTGIKITATGKYAWFPHAEWKRSLQTRVIADPESPATEAPPPDPTP